MREYYRPVIRGLAEADDIEALAVARRGRPAGP